MSIKKYQKNRSAQKYKSPLRKLVKFFENSRNQWKEKHQVAKKNVKRLSNRVHYLEQSKAQWKQKAIALEIELKQLKLFVENQDLDSKKNQKPLVPSGALEAFEKVPFHHQYSIGHMMLYLSLVLIASISFRGAGRVLETVMKSFQLSLPVPSWHTARFWLFRFGYYKLIRPKEVANDWVWIVDHTIQLGSEKCWVILGLRLENLPPVGECLKHENLEPISLVPVKKSNGNIVFEQLEETLHKTGIPRQIVGDYGSDLKAGIDKFCQKHPETDYIHDIKHQTAILLKQELQNDPIWNQFTHRSALTKLELQQTPLAFLSPPNQRSKSRYMNVDVLVQWGQKILAFLSVLERDEKAHEKLGWIIEYRDSIIAWEEMTQVIGLVETRVRKRGYFIGCHQELKQLLSKTYTPEAKKMSQKLLDFVATQELKAKPRERLVGSSEVIESVLGKQKYLEHEQSKSGFTGLLLGIAAMVGSLTTELVLEAIEKVKTNQVLKWCQENLGQTLQGKRRQVFSGKKTE